MYRIYRKAKNAHSAHSAMSNLNCPDDWRKRKVRLHRDRPTIGPPDPTKGQISIQICKDTSTKGAFPYVAVPYGAAVQKRTRQPSPDGKLTSE